MLHIVPLDKYQQALRLRSVLSVPLVSNQAQNQTVFFFKDLFIIYFFILFIFGCIGSQLRHLGSSLRRADLSWQRAGSSLWCAGFSLAVAHRLQGAWALQLWRAGSRMHGLCSLRHTGSLVDARELSSCGTWAQLPRGMGDLSFPTRDQTCVRSIVR